jgi:Rieske Fe-S protein
MRLGHIKDFPIGETFLHDKRFLVRHDSDGYSAMSTLCTHDLSALSLTPEGHFVSEFNPSRYAHDGRVLKGPSKKDLPYYELVLDRDDIDKPLDYFFVRVGTEVTSDWRLKVK